MAADSEHGHIVGGLTLRQTPAYLENLTKAAVIAGLIGAYRGFRMTFGSERRLRRTQRAIRRLVAGGQRLWVELGGGARKGDNGWLVMDMDSECDYWWDLRRRLPFPDGSVEKIYSSHFLEHLTFRQGQRHLSECLRSLAPGGTISVCVPSARPYIEAYCLGKPLARKPWIHYEPAWNDTTPIDWVNYIAYMDEVDHILLKHAAHQYMFDEENLLKVLEAAGFRNARLREFDPSLDLEFRDYESIYALAEK
jgi:predicted SAM-dependent methyltransferase